MNYSRIKWYDISNGPGVRASLFASGCTHKCKGCFNQVTWDFNYGDKWTDEVEQKFIDHLNRPEIVGVNILGGEPLQQDESLLNLLKRIYLEVKKPIWLWTGFDIIDIIQNGTELQRQMIYLCDVVVDGRFVESKKDLNLKYRGSSNQRVIDIKATLDKNRTDVDFKSVFNKDMLIQLEGC